MNKFEYGTLVRVVGDSPRYHGHEGVVKGVSSAEGHVRVRFPEFGRNGHTVEMRSEYLAAIEPEKQEATELFATINYSEHSLLGSHWVCRLSEPGGYVWHGQVAHTDFTPNLSRDSFVEKCREFFGEITVR